MLKKIKRNLPDGISLGIDARKSDIINFIVENEGLNSFKETEHFYYWFLESERALMSNYNFIMPGPFMFKFDGNEYDLNSFDGIAQLVINVKSVEKINMIFSGPPIFGRTEFFLRYSKKYKKLEYYTNSHSIEKNKPKDKYYIRHDTNKFFCIDEKNHVRIYISKRMIRYISNKSVAFFRGNLRYRNTNEDFYLKLNRRLLNVHLGQDFYKSDRDFLDENLVINHLSNKQVRGCASLEDLLRKMTKNMPVPKILRNKMDTPNLISLYNLVEYQEIDKIIKFLYENHEYLNKLNSIEIIEMYMGTNLGLLKKDIENKRFSLNETKKENNNEDAFDPFGAFYNYPMQELRDYIRMSVTLDCKVNLNIKGLKRLRTEHDALSRKVSVSKLPQLTVKKFYPNIENSEGFEIEKIEDKNRLVLESEIQRHCVKTYAMSINKGTCCIYSFLDSHDGNRYTLEIRAYKNKKSKQQVFILAQIRGKFNATPKKNVMDRVFRVLMGSNVYMSIDEAVKGGFVLQKDNPDPFEVVNFGWQRINENEIELPF